MPRISVFYGISIWMYWNEGVHARRAARPTPADAVFSFGQGNDNIDFEQADDDVPF